MIGSRSMRKRTKEPAGPDQLSLFAPEPESPRAADAALEALARRLPPHLRLGTSSWTFPGWKGLVYHRTYGSERAFLRESLAEYARHPLFRTVGIDRAYYAPVPEGELAAYLAQLPDGFLAVSKVWSEITTPVFPRHPRYGERAGQPNPRFLDPALFDEVVGGPHRRAFARATGPFVVEIPPSPLSPSRLEHALERFLSDAGGEFRFAVEVRDRRLLTPGYFRVLASHGATHVFNYWERMPDIGAQLALAGSMPGPFVVARLLIPPGRRYAELVDAWEPFDRLVEPQPAMREDVCTLIEEAGRRGYEVFVIVNNKAEGSSPLTVRALAERLVERAGTSA